MHVIILAAGFGKRTQGVLKDTPKCLVTTADGKTILEHLLIDLSLIQGITQIVITTNEKYFMSIKISLLSFRAKGEKSSPDLSGRKHASLDFSVASLLRKDMQEFKINSKQVMVTTNGKQNPEDRLGALGDINYVLEKVGGIGEVGDIIVTPSDTTFWHSFFLTSFYAFQEKYPEDFVTIVRDVKDKNIIRGRFGNPVINDQNIITSFVEKPDEPASTLVTAPFYVYRKKHITLLQQYLKEGENPDSPGMIIPYLLKYGQTVRGFIVENKIIDAGTPGDIEKAKKY